MRIYVQHPPLQEKLAQLAKESGVSVTAYIAHLISQQPEPKQS